MYYECLNFFCTNAKDMRQMILLFHSMSSLYVDASTYNTTLRLYTVYASPHSPCMYSFVFIFHENIFVDIFVERFRVSMLPPRHSPLTDRLARNTSLVGIICINTDGGTLCNV